MSRDSRKAKIEALEAVRKSHVISYVTSTRQNFEGAVAMDVIEPIYNHLVAIAAVDDEPVIDLFLHTNGGDGIVPWRLVTLIREYAKSFNVLVPNRAFSAGTLTALGADTVVMHPMGMLGPTDATVSNQFNPPNPMAPGQQLGISVEDVASYFQLVKTDVGITHEDELVQALTALTAQVHPLALGNVKRSTLQSQMMGKKLLQSRKDDSMSEHDIGEIVRKLTSELFYHGHPINRAEARDELGLKFVLDAPPDVADAMWALYLEYAASMKLNQPFEPLLEAMAISTIPAAAAPTVVMGQNGPMNIAGGAAPQPIPLEPMIGTCIESAAMCDVHITEVEVTLTRDPMGAINGQTNMVGRGWTTELGSDPVSDAAA